MANIQQQSLWSHHWECQRTAWSQLAQFFNSPETFVSAHHEMTIKDKDHDPTTILLIKVNGQYYVVKRYNVKSWAHRLKVAMRGTHVVRSWRCANYLYYDTDLALAEPIAYYETRYGPLKGIGYIISSYLQQAVKAGDKLVEHETSAIQGLAQVVYALYQAGVIHHDLQLENILFIKDQPYLVDFDHVQYFNVNARSGWNHHIADMQRLALCLNEKQKQLFYDYVLRYYHHAPSELTHRVKTAL